MYVFHKIPERLLYTSYTILPRFPLSYTDFPTDSTFNAVITRVYEMTNEKYCYCGFITNWKSGCFSTSEI